VPELTEAQLYDLGNTHSGSFNGHVWSAFIKTYMQDTKRLKKRIDRLQAKVRKLERRKHARP
jgi:hypothetical protein